MTIMSSPFNFQFRRGRNCVEKFVVPSIHMYLFIIHLIVNIA